MRSTLITESLPLGLTCGLPGTWLIGKLGRLIHYGLHKCWLTGIFLKPGDHQSWSWNQDPAIANILRGVQVPKRFNSIFSQRGRWAWKWKPSARAAFLPGLVVSSDAL